MIKLRVHLLLVLSVLFFWGLERTGVFNSEVVDSKKFQNYYIINKDEGESVLKEDYFTVKRNYEKIEFNRKPGFTKEVKIFDYSVAKGDIIEEVAKKFYVETKILEYINPKLGKNLKIGEKISIPSENGIFYKVLGGDNLGKISRNFGVEIAKILEYNNFIIDDRLQKNEDIFLINPDLKKMVEYKRQLELEKIKNSKREKGKLSRKVELYSNIQNFIMPIKYTGLTSPFGNRFHPVLKRYIGHAGADLRARYIPFWAAKSGVVKFAGVQSGYGKIVIITHSNGYETRYAHLTKYNVKVGERVKQGQILGQTGMTGRVTGPHLHFEVRKNGRILNPLRAVGKIK